MTMASPSEPPVSPPPGLLFAILVTLLYSSPISCNTGDDRRTKKREKVRDIGYHCTLPFIFHLLRAFITLLPRDCLIRSG